ncbi:ribosomal-protein-serine acetyltransferase [Cytobacillus horneckiae]|uniref:GNAT family N-acetyltransferase n=1 Tax=Cytobacillus horneckiae TaxID=549687 RepID=UPI0019D0637C|nr:GNAT family protein [Cytobacillus horneckiae]MBN6885921.1 GNAT family N-acetyltransferase [Cytobacillus horneckiae]MCM3177463.1 GNAT family N-acetyltransferase [Cytobacillus horneckiae]
MFTYKVDKDISIEMFQQHHKEEFYSFIDENRSHLRQWLLWVDKRKSPDDMKPVIEAFIQKYAENNGFDAGIRYKGKLVGMIGLHAIDWKNRTTSIGYLLGEKIQGKGIITKTVSALISYIFTELELNRIEIQCAASNYKSIAIPERLGFTKEEIQREGQWLYDHYEDIITYSMLRREWTCNNTNDEKNENLLQDK